MWPHVKFTANLAIVSKEILNGKVNFYCSDNFGNECSNDTGWYETRLLHKAAIKYWENLESNFSFCKQLIYLFVTCFVLF